MSCQGCTNYCSRDSPSIVTDLTFRLLASREMETERSNGVEEQGANEGERLVGLALSRASLGYSRAALLGSLSSEIAFHVVRTVDLALFFRWARLAQ